MKKIIIKKEYSCFIFGEGQKDKNFLKALIDLEKFKYHTSSWTFNYSNASGGSAKIILEKCRKEIANYSYNLILCFIDLDGLKNDFPKTWEKEKDNLEKDYPDFVIIWQFDNLEDEHKKVLGTIKGKRKINQEAKKQIEKFINSDFWKRILEPIKNKERELKK